ncbi:hypothetical protein [Flavobacterium sp. J27]|uniref:hypothetical protein n=1 Tax=Flavobacterium sp. J27 TaxID=2060419 RepID=UPI0010308B28|nr:hypothetical protein [Flavobacterium sp. J27]
MKKISCIILFFVTTTSLFSQKLSKDELKTKLAEVTCKCAEGKEMTKDNYELSLGLCILEAVNKYQPDVEKHYGKDYISKIEEIGGDVGEKVAVVCPNLLLKILETSGSDFNDSATDAVDETYEDDIIEGTFVSTSVDGFLYVKVKEATGKTNQFLLINSFENSYLILDKVLKANDKVKVYYFDAELYNAKTNKYEYFKVINDLVKL